VWGSIMVVKVVCGLKTGQVAITSSMLSSDTPAADLCGGAGRGEE